MHSNRTFSHLGEPFTVAAAQSLNKLTQSYTIQPILTMNGTLVGKLFVILQEHENELGPTQRQNLPDCSGLFITCSKSDEITNHLSEVQLDQVLAPVVKDLGDEECALYFNSLATRKEAAKYREVGLDVTL